MSVQHPGRQESVNKKKERASTGKKIVSSDGAHGEQEGPGGGDCFFFEGHQGETLNITLSPVV